MYYVEELTIPSLTYQATPQITVMGLAPGWIKRVAIAFPPGPRGLAHLQVYRYEHQLYPTTPGASFAWDNRVYEFADNYPLLGVPYEVKLLAWNLDDTYAQIIEVGIEVAVYSVDEMLYQLMQQGMGGAFG